jgi:hypothetical protein
MFFWSGPTALAPEGGVQMAVERTAHAMSYAPRVRQAALSGSSKGENPSFAGG